MGNLFAGLFVAFVAGVAFQANSYFYFAVCLACVVLNVIAVMELIP